MSSVRIIVPALLVLAGLIGCGKSLPPGQSEYAEGLNALYSADTLKANQMFLKAEENDPTRLWRLIGKGKYYETYMSPFEALVYYWQSVQSAPDFDSAYVRYCQVALNLGRRDVAARMAARMAERFNLSPNLTGSPSPLEREYQLILAGIDYNAGEYAHVESRLNSLESAFPNSARVKFLLAQALYRLGKTDAADKKISDAKSASDDSRADYEAGINCLVSCNRAKEAMDMLDEMRDEFDNDMNVRRVAFQSYLALGYYDHADQLIYKLREDKFPEYVFWYYRGQLAEAGGEFQPAYLMYEYSLTFEHTCMAVYRDMARVIAAQNNFVKMEDNMNSTLYYTETQGYPPDVFDESRLEFAEYYAQTRQWAQALEQAFKARKSYAGTARLEMLEASVLGRMLQEDSAMDRLDKFATQAEASVPKYQGLARVWGQLGNIDSADYYLNKALEISPADIGMRLTKAQITLQRGDSTGYKQALQELHVQFPNDKRATRALAGWLAANGDPVGTLDLANQLIDAFPGDLSTYKLAARTATARYGVEQGRDYLRKAVTNNPKLPAAEHMLALDFINSGKVDSASAHVKEALTLDSMYEPALLAKGVIYESRQMPDSAIALYKHLTDVNPLNADAFNNLAWALATNSLELPTSSNLAREAIGLSGGLNANMHGTLGWTYYRQKLYKEASNSYKFAIQLEPNDPFKHYLAGVNFADWGKLPEAKAQLDTALQLGLTTQYSSVLKAKVDSLENR